MSTRTLILVGLVMFALLNVCLMALYVLARPTKVQAEELPVYATVPDFSLTTQAGVPLSRDDLAGKIWIADFVFTSCAGPCPIMSRNMAGVAERLAPYPDVALVSITVDPDTDTPEVLTRYAAKYGADPAQWHFLTGSGDAIQALAVKGFMLGSVDDPIIHSPKFCLVDRTGQIRGYFTGTDEADMDRLVAAVHQLIGT